MVLAVSAILWALVALAVTTAADAKAPNAKAAVTAEGTSYTNDTLDFPAWVNPVPNGDVCEWLYSLGAVTANEQNVCRVRNDYDGSIRFRLGRVAAGTDALLGLPDIGANRGPLDYVNDQTKATSLKLTTANDHLAGVKADTAAALTIAADTRAAVELTATRLNTTNDRLSTLDDHLADLEAATEAVALAIEEQGPNVGSATFPGTSDENPSVVRLASSEYDASELVERAEQSVMFGAGLLAALVVGGLLWRSALGADA